jgi:hypothetical protein
MKSIDTLQELYIDRWTSLPEIVPPTPDQQITMRINTIFSIGSIAASSIALSLVLAPQAQAVNLVTNGDFSSALLSGSQVTDSVYLGDNNITVSGWTLNPQTYTGNSLGISRIPTSGYNFLVQGGTDFRISMEGGYSDPWGGQKLAGGATQSVYSATGSASNPGWFIAADAEYYAGSISQTLSNLIVGDRYTLSFYQSAGQIANGYSSAINAQWNVSFGGTTLVADKMTMPYASAPVGSQTATSTYGSSTNLVNGVWQQETMTFTATAQTEVLKFLASGGPVGMPPFALLSNVSVTANTQRIPEPFTIIGTIIGGTAAFRLKKKLDDTAK